MTCPLNSRWSSAFHLTPGRGCRPISCDILLQNSVPFFSPCFHQVRQKYIKFKMLKTVLSLFLHHNPAAGLRVAASCRSSPVSLQAALNEPPQRNGITESHPSATSISSGPTSFSSYFPRGLHSSSSSRMCRWVEEASSGDQEATNDPSNGGHSRPGPLSDASHEKAIEVRMESQVVFDAVWRRFEDKYRLKVRIPVHS